MNPKSLRRVAMAAVGDGLAAGRAAVGLEVGATVARAGWAAVGLAVGATVALADTCWPGLGWASVVVDPRWHPASVTAATMAIAATARRWVFRVTVLLLSVVLHIGCWASRPPHVLGPQIAQHRGRPGWRWFLAAVVDDVAVRGPASRDRRLNRPGLRSEGCSATISGCPTSAARRRGEAAWRP